MFCSVAMSTYNGERFLAEQLSSICAQTRPVDEIVVSDDALPTARCASSTIFVWRIPRFTGKFCPPQRITAFARAFCAPSRPAAAI